VTSDYLALFIVDINRSFEGLTLALEQDPPAMQQGALHARDLADALGSVGLAQISALTSDISGQLGMESPSILPIAKTFTGLMKKALLELEASDSNTPLPQQIAMIAEISASMSELMGQTPPTPMLYENVMDQVLGDTREQDAEIKPREVATRVEPSTAWDPEQLFAQRRSGLNIVQRVREMVHQSGTKQSAEMDFLLAEHQDALSTLGQIEFKEALSHLSSQIQGDGVYADREILETLASALRLIPKGYSIQVSKQALSLFIDIRGAQASMDQIDEAGAILTSIMGRIDQTNDYLRMVLPSSLKRMRMIPFKRGDRTYAVSWVQLLSISNFNLERTTPDLLGPLMDSTKMMRLCSGVQIHALYASEIYPVINMNTFLLPRLLKGPAWMKGVALDGASRPFTWVCL
jgi:hypothetical protein